jgi:hypothetical protein
MSGLSAFLREPVAVKMPGRKPYGRLKNLANSEMRQLKKVSLKSPQSMSQIGLGRANMRTVATHGSAVLGAGLVVAAAVGSTYWRADVFANALFWGCVMAIVMGTPLYLILARFFKIDYLLSALVGVVVAVLPAALFLWPDVGSTDALVSVWSEGTALVQDGVTTPAGWRDFWLMLFKLGAIGGTAAVAYHAIVRRGTSAS